MIITANSIGQKRELLQYMSGVDREQKVTGNSFVAIVCTFIYIHKSFTVYYFFLLHIILLILIFIILSTYLTYI